MNFFKNGWKILLVGIVDVGSWVVEVLWFGWVIVVVYLYIGDVYFYVVFVVDSVRFIDG